MDIISMAIPGKNSDIGVTKMASASTMIPSRRIEWHFAEVIETITETPWTKSLVLRLPNWPGHLPGERLEDGEVSPYLTDELRPGDRLEIRGPIGGYFTWTVAMGGPLFFVAGGSGIVPLMAMLRHRAAQGSNLPVRLLYSSRSYEHIIFRNELEQLAAADRELQIFHTLTRTSPPNWSGYRRRIDEPMLAGVAPPPAQKPHIFICGPTPLVEFVATSLVDLGHEPARIRTERFGPTGA